MGKIMTSKKPLTIEEIQEIGRSSVGLKIKDIVGKDIEEDINHKGQLGHLIEEYLFHQKPHNDPEPDFKEAGVELKVTPIKKLKNGLYSSKERLVLNMIDYENENVDNFEKSSFWKKNKRLYILFYEYIKGLPKSEYKIHDELMHVFSEEDLKQIQKDWEVIASKIKNGEAHLISESDTFYLAACTKGIDGSKTKSQRNNKEEAKGRAYSLKSSYVTGQIRKLKDKTIFSITKGSNQDLESYISNRIKPYLTKPLSELLRIFEITSKAKNVNEQIIAAILGYKGKKLSNAEEFIKGSVRFKTIVLDNKLNLKESMSFENFKFEEIILENWNDSTLREYFLTTKFAFSVFKGPKSNPTFLGIKFWNMQEDIIDTELKQVWEKTVQVIKEGRVYKMDNSNVSNFPKLKDSKVCHVRPKGRNSLDVYLLPKADQKTGRTTYTKQCFWLNASYIKSLVLELFKLS
jgi:DNA mismatch repair protein MutH